MTERLTTLINNTTIKNFLRQKLTNYIIYTIIRKVSIQAQNQGRKAINFRQVQRRGNFKMALGDIEREMKFASFPEEIFMN